MPPTYESCIADFCDPQTYVEDGGLWESLRKNDDIYTAFGCHPHSASLWTDHVGEVLMARCIDDKCVAVGEMGLDYSIRNNVDHDVQKVCFIAQIQIAVALDKPIVIHCRDADTDCFEILQQHVPSHHKIHRHCFTKDRHEANKWMRAFPNLYIGLTPIIHRPPADLAQDLNDVVEFVKEDRLLIETDAPYFLPNFLKNPDNGGLRNSHPGMGIYVAMKIANIRQRSVPDILRRIRQNTTDLYGI